MKRAIKMFEEINEINDIKGKRVRVVLHDNKMFEGVVVFNGRTEILLRIEEQYIIFNKEYVKFIEVP